MPEAEIATTEQTAQANPTEKGRVERAVMPQLAEETQNTNTEDVLDGNLETNGQADTPQFSDEQIAAFLKTKGISFDGQWEKLKEKVDYTPPVVFTTEQKKEQEAAFEKRMIDRYISRGGKVEDYVSLKGLTTADVAELSRLEVMRELKAEGFSDEEIPQVLKDRYFVGVDPNSLEQGEDETDEEFEARKAQVTKKVKYGAKKLANRSSYIKSQAELVLNQYKAELEAEDAEAADDIKFSATVENYFRAMPRTTTVQLGEISPGLTPEPIEHQFSEDSVQKAATILKDPAQLKQFFNNQDGTPNLEKLADLLIQHFDSQEKMKKIYLEALTRNTRVFQNVFPARSAGELGVNGAPQKNNQGKGPATSYGKPQRVV